MSLAQLMAAVCRFKRDEDGPTATEYAVLLSLVIILCLVAVAAIGGRVTGMFQSVDACLPG